MCIIIIIIIIIILPLDFSFAYMFLASNWKELLRVELESALRDLGMNYIKVQSKDILEGS